MENFGGLGGISDRTCNGLAKEKGEEGIEGQGRIKDKSYIFFTLTVGPSNQELELLTKIRED